MACVINGTELIEHHDNAVKAVFDTVTSTMGPDGKFSLLSSGQVPKVTKDGVTVARSIKMDNPVEDLFAQVITEASVRTDRDCGDGTTTTVFLTKEFYHNFKGYTSFNDKRRIDEILKYALRCLAKRTISVTTESKELEALARTTSNNDESIYKPTFVCR